jgi:carbamoyl-phosphate synthase small subunit
MINAQLQLDNGYIASGTWLNPKVNLACGEVVFTTAMTGYEETLTDPSYAGQILVFTYPLLGNYGVGSPLWWESAQIYPNAIICSSLMNNGSHFMQQSPLLEWLIKHGVAILSNVDTRALTKVLRDHGSRYGAAQVVSPASIAAATASPESTPPQPLAPVAQPLLAELVPLVSCTSIKTHGNGRYKIILVDFGVKQNIIRELLKFDVTLQQVPYDYDYSAVQCDGIILSNGPGDPKSCKVSIAVLRAALKQQVPLFGICLGAQLLGLAAGADTYKLKFGHRGHNQPVQEQNDKRCYLTAQNHGYAIAEQSLSSEWQVSFRHLHDGSVAGIQHKSKPFAAVQFHPEAASGPQDTGYLFTEFMHQVINYSQQRLKLKHNTTNYAS